MRARRIADIPLRRCQPGFAGRAGKRMSGVMIEVKHAEGRDVTNRNITAAPALLSIPHLSPFILHVALPSFILLLVIRHSSPLVPETSFYKRATFVTHLPVECRYSPSHFWLREIEPDHWRVGFTKFATRMLGEIVEVQWEKTDGVPVAGGEIIGSIEGFKAISDIYCVASGTFAGGNLALRADIELVSREPYAAGWLYEIHGQPDAKCVDVATYRSLLDSTIDHILEKQQGEESSEG